MYEIAIGEFQIAVLRTMSGKRSPINAVSICAILEDKLGHEVAMPQVYRALKRLEAMGLLSSELDRNKSSGRGRTRRFYKMSENGKKILATASTLTGREPDYEQPQGSAQPA